MDGLRFPGIVDSFLEGEWRSWGGGDPAEPSDEETEISRARHRDIVRECGHRVTLNTYLQRLDLSSSTPPAATNAIQCITVHRSKGLQFRHVYLIGMAQEVFPSYRALQRGRKSKEVQEERRNCFVAITRAQETLTLTRARKYFGWAKGPSQFSGGDGGGHLDLNATFLEAQKRDESPPRPGKDRNLDGRLEFPHAPTGNLFDYPQGGVTALKS